MASKKKNSATTEPLKVGRPTKLNAETTQKICDAILVGATYEGASEYAGIAYSTFNEWMAEGRVAAEPNEFTEFSEAVRQANANAQVYFAKDIKAAAAKDWRAAAWMLERRFPKAYGLRVGPIDENEIDHAIESELARLGAARQSENAGETALPSDDAAS